MTSVMVAAIIPIAEFAGDELLLVEEAGLFALPAGPLHSGERVLDAARRIVLERTGLMGETVRLVYILEQADGALLFGVHCLVSENGTAGEPVSGSIVSLRGDVAFAPMAIREVLVEDLRSGFVRPVAHVIEPSSGEAGPPVVSW